MSRVIKAGAPECLLKAVPMNLQPIASAVVRQSRRANAGQEAESVMDKARREADIIVRSARGDGETIREQARSEGYAAGMAEAVSATQALIQKLESQIAVSEAEIQSFLNEIEPQLLKLCVEAVEKVIRHEIKTDPRVVTRAIRTCLRKVKDSDEVRVRVSPAEVAQVRAERDELLHLAEGVRAINIIDDRRVSPGGCVVESAIGDFDATVETQMERIEKRIMETFDNDANDTGSGPEEIQQSDQQD